MSRQEQEELRGIKVISIIKDKDETKSVRKFGSVGRRYHSKTNDSRYEWSGEIEAVEYDMGSTGTRVWTTGESGRQAILARTDYYSAEGKSKRVILCVCIKTCVEKKTEKQTYDEDML